MNTAAEATLSISSEVIRKAPFEFHPEHCRKKIKTVQVSKLADIFGAKLSTSIPEFQKYVETLLGLNSDVVFDFVEGTVTINIPNVYESVADWWCRLRGYSFFYGEKPIIDRVDAYIDDPYKQEPPQPEFFVLYAYIKATEAADNLYSWPMVVDVWADKYFQSDLVWGFLQEKWIEGFKSFHDDVDVDRADGFTFHEYGFDFVYTLQESGCHKTQYRLFTLITEGKKVETRLLILRDGYWIAAPYAHLNFEILQTMEKIL